ncbi:hypothetical protein [Sphingorhabdus sp.]|uniref:hypothetical protein n=1 Tax=Sphingorhabdus sp. TaxID=1902408 RepID=UPI0037C7A145
MVNFTERHFARLIVGIWLCAAFGIALISRDAISAWKMGDPDDQMRILQVRDWVAGQSWWDITQYRMNAPAGGDMHWSRLVDVPLALFIRLLTPVMGQAIAEQVSASIVPLLTLGVALWFYALGARRLFGATVAVVATALVITIAPFTTQMIPMRIDHHGWQIVCFVVALWALFDRHTKIWSAVVLGLACALWIEISIEGLPFAALALGISALGWVFPQLAAVSDHGRLRFPVALASIAIGALVFFSITERWSASNFCDALSPVHIAALSVMAAVIIAAVLLEKAAAIFATVYFRLAACAAAAVSGAAMLLSIAPQCAGDAFARLDPLVREYWFESVPEGLPLWAAPLDFAIQQYAYILVGCVALALVLLFNKQLLKADKIRMALLFLGTVIIGAFVSRTAVYAMMVANLFLAATLVGGFITAESYKNVILRMALRIGAILLAMPNVSAQFIIDERNAAEAKADPALDRLNRNFGKQTWRCQKTTAIAALDRLPPSPVMATLDTNPAILQFTRHVVVASGHHRNQAAMADVIRTFTGVPDQAAQVIVARRIRYLITCDGSYELALYARKAPKGLLAQLRGGRVPAWLKRQPDIGPFQIYAVDRTQLPDIRAEYD